MALAATYSCGIAVDFCQARMVSSNSSALQHNVTFPVTDHFRAHVHVLKRGELQETKFRVNMATDQISLDDVEY